MKWYEEKVDWWRELQTGNKQTYRQEENIKKKNRKIIIKKKFSLKL